MSDGWFAYLAMAVLTWCIYVVCMIRRIDDEPLNGLAHDVGVAVVIGALWPFTVAEILLGWVSARWIDVLGEDGDDDGE